MTVRTGKCASCKKVNIIGGRNLDRSCYARHRNNGTLDKFPRSTWKHAELMAEYELCKARGLSVREAAEKIGVKLSALRQAIHRARQKEPSPVGARSA